MSFEDYLKANAQKIEEELDKILAEFLVEAKKISPKLVLLIKEFIKSCEGGKRIRGVLCKLGYELANSKFEIRNLKLEIYRVGAALEIMHAAILAHDDIIDESPKRRGIPSLYKTVGVYQAITLADLGFFLSTKIMAETGNPKLLIMFSQTMINTAIGQIMDIYGEDALVIARYKTAQYTISGPLILGAILADADEKLIKILKEFGDNLGIAFQIKDDILDGEGDNALSKVMEYTAKAKKLIPDITADKEMNRLLEGMCEFLVERKK